MVYFAGIEDNLDQLSSLLYEKVTSGTFTWTKEAFEIEKQTVLQEYEDTFNEQTSGVVENLFRRYYNYFNPIGLRSDIEAFTYEQSLAFRERFKTPNLVCQVGSGLEFSWEKPNATPRDLPKFGAYEAPLEIVPKEGKTVVGLISKAPVSKECHNQVQMVLNCLNDGLESPLYQEIREIRGLSYYSAGHLDPVRGSSVPLFFSATSNAKAKKLRKVYEDFFSGDLSRHITPDRFEDCYSANRVGLRMCELLPHTGAKVTALEDSPYTGLEGFTYEKCLETLQKYLTLDNFEEFSF
jgi:predicted Zn-dependent peptidase